MAIQLMLLRNVPADELAEVCSLLDAHDIAYYETSAGTFGISLPALWLHDESRYDQARTLLDAYSAERYARARAEFEALKAAGRKRTFLDIARENPLRFVLYLALAGGLAWVSTVPFLQMFR
jgi:hypothetical protein